MKERLQSRVTGDIEWLKRRCSFKIHEFRFKDDGKQKAKTPQPDNGASGQRRKLNWTGEKFEKAEPILPDYLPLLCLLVNPAHNICGKIRRNIPGTGSLFPGAILLIIVHDLPPSISFMAA